MARVGIVSKMDVALPELGSRVSGMRSRHAARPVHSSNEVRSSATASNALARVQFSPVVGDVVGCHARHASLVPWPSGVGLGER